MASQPLWRCPVCGQQFVTRNMPHSCDVVGLEEFFAGAEPRLRALFDRLVAAARENGPVVVNAARSRVSLQARMRFASVEQPRKTFLAAVLVLTTPIRSSRMARIDHVSPYYYLHRLRLREPGDIDDELMRWLAAAYQVGIQRHVSESGWPKLRRPPAWVHVPSRSA